MGTRNTLGTIAMLAAMASSYDSVPLEAGINRRVETTPKSTLKASEQAKRKSKNKAAKKARKISRGKS